MNLKTTLSPSQRRALLSCPVNVLACGFGTGLVPKAQGTFGSLVAVLLWRGLYCLPLWAYLLVIVLGFVVGVWVCDVASRALGVDDHRSLVWDEFVGQWLALLPLCLPVCRLSEVMLWWCMVAGFALFRLFDIWKPWPIGWCDRHVKGGFGVMVDDMIAGAFAALVLVVLLSFLC